jgi:hypothetical protein
MYVLVKSRKRKYSFRQLPRNPAHFHGHPYNDLSSLLVVYSLHLAEERCKLQLIREALRPPDPIIVFCTIHAITVIPRNSLQFLRTVRASLQRTVKICYSSFLRTYIPPHCKDMLQFLRSSDQRTVKICHSSFLRTSFQHTL